MPPVTEQWYEAARDNIQSHHLRLDCFLLSNMLPLTLLLASGVTASTHEATPRGEGLKWGPCETLNNTRGLPVECTNLIVPLDYADDAGNKTLELDLIKYPAQVEPKLGTVILNFGGPGQDGLNSMLAYAPIQAP